MADSPEPDLWRRALDMVNDAVWAVDRSWRVVYANRAARRLVDRPVDALSGRDVRELFPETVGSEREAAIGRVLAGGPAERLSVEHPRLHTVVEFRVQPDPVGAQVVVATVDRRAELEHRSSLEAAILASVREGIYAVDADNRVTLVNAAACRMLGYPVETLLGRNSHAAWHHSRADGSPYPESACPLVRTLQDGQARDVTDLLWRADGSALEVEYHAAPIEREGRIVGAVVSFRDLSDRIVAEQAKTAAATAIGALYELQQALQPPPPPGDDPCLGVCYLPADAAGAGGDLYDWQTLPEEGMHVAVVDVVGAGLVAARDALAVTHALRLLVLARTPLDQVVRQASWLLADAYPDLAATAVLARYDHGSGRLRLASAGHPPPLLVHPDGTTRYLEASGRPIGWPDAGTDDVVDVVVPRGGRVVFYTDGLVEAGRDILAGMRQLAELAATVRELPAGQAARALVTEVLSGASRRDDCLALVLDRPAGH